MNPHARNILDLWLAYPDDFIDEAVSDRYRAMLSAEERERLESFKFETSRREYLAAHVLLRTALSYRASAPPDTWTFRTNKYGKPSLDPAYGMSFNLSRRLGLVACVIASGEATGLDVESHQRANQVLEVRETVFTAKEIAQLAVMTFDQQCEHALSLWTLKEAYTKARGLGLSLPFDQFSFLREPSGALKIEIDPIVGDDPGRWRFCLCDHAEHRLALATEQQLEAPLQVRELRPTLEPSFRSVTVHADWFPCPQESA